VFARYTLPFALQLKKKHGKTSVRVAGEMPVGKEYTKQSILVNKNNDIRNQFYNSVYSGVAVFCFVTECLPHELDPTKQLNF